MQTTDWETEIADLLTELSTVQEELLAALTAKRAAMVAGDLEELGAVQAREEILGERLEACHQRRGALLEEAGEQGLPSESIAQLATTQPGDRAVQLGDQVQQIAARTRLLRHHSLTNWVLAQRSLLHLSQLLEILATGGRIQPTYSKEEAADSRGALVDRAA